MLWPLSVLVELILHWWWEFALYEVTDWSLGIFASLVVGLGVTLFLMAALLFPDRIDGYESCGDFFLGRRYRVFAIFGLTFLFGVVDTLIRAEPYFDRLGVDYMVQILIGPFLSSIAIWTSNRPFHLGW